MEKPWKTHGTPMENTWKTHGKPWKSHGKAMNFIGHLEVRFLDILGSWDLVLEAELNQWPQKHVS
jgi:hypothetical protein